MNDIASVMATWRTKAHGVLYRLERGFEELANFPTKSATARRKVVYEWEIVMTRAIADLEAQAEEFDSDDIREAITYTRQRTGYIKCEIPLTQKGKA